jgi:hypothetical protein
MAICRFLMIGALVSGLSLPPALADAADSDGRYVVRGVGASNCQQLVSIIDESKDEIRNEAVMLYTSWLNGYLSFVNRVEQDTYDVIPLADSTQLLSIIANQCRANPDALVESVSAQIIGSLSQAKIPAESPLVTVETNDLKVQLRQSVIVALQQKLIDLEYLNGVADGHFGPKSQKALKAFQKSENLNETGFPDTDTLLRALLK